MRSITNIAKGQDEEFNKRGDLIAFGEGPYYIMKSIPAIHHTMGGIKINPEAQVVNVDGNVIENLYAAGEVTGGIHGTNRLGSDAIADIMVFGRIAALTRQRTNKQKFKFSRYFLKRKPVINQKPPFFQK